MMERKNGSQYAQNYDVIVKWLADALRGQTLEVIGVKTGRIEEVFGFEPVDIVVRAGRVDVMLRDEHGNIFHLEEQRNLLLSDLYRSAAYHFLGAKQWGANITDIVLASGHVYSGEKVVTTRSGKYEPIVIDFSQRDGRKRLAEIRHMVEEGNFDNWLELVFLPLCGRETGAARAEMVERVIRFETELFHAKRLSANILAATLVMSNKLIDKERIKELWEEIKMLDVLEVAREKGMEEGVEKGKTLGAVETSHKLLLSAITEKFGFMPPRLADQVRKIDNQDTLDALFRQVFRCADIAAFENVLRQVVADNDETQGAF